MLSPQEHRSRILKLELALMVQPPLLSPITARNVCTHLTALQSELCQVTADLAQAIAAINMAEPSAELSDYQEQWHRAVRLRLKLEDALCEAQVYLARRLKPGQQEELSNPQP